MAHPDVRHIARYTCGGETHWGRRDGDQFVRLDAPPWLGGHDTDRVDPARDVTLNAPATPTKVVCVGLNYRAHIAESLSVAPGSRAPDEPLLFLKPPSAVIASGEPIRYPPGVTRLDPEAEVAVILARRTRAVSVEDAWSCVAGLTAFNDVSARNYQKLDGQWTRAKGFDTFAPLGPWIAVGLDPLHVGIECRVNGERRQNGNTADLLFPIPFLVSFISHVMTLEPGDVIATGTPAGIAPVEIGDHVEIEVEGVGILENHVEAWRP